MNVALFLPLPVSCEQTKEITLNVSWVLRYSPCSEEYIVLQTERVCCISTFNDTFYFVKYNAAVEYVHRTCCLALKKLNVPVDVFIFLKQPSKNLCKNNSCSINTIVLVCCIYTRIVFRTWLLSLCNVFIPLQ